MAAMMLERDAPKRWPEPEGRGHDLLVRWADYTRGRDVKRNPVASGSWEGRIERGKDSAPPFVLQIDDLLAELNRGFDTGIFYVRTVKRFYLGGEPIWAIAALLHRTEGFIHLSLNAVRDLVDKAVIEA